MSSEAQVILDVWDAVRDHIAHAKRPAIAQDLLIAFAEYGFEGADISTIVDEDPDLAAAFEEVFLDPEDDDEGESA
jgi:hypothetical protein